MIRQTLWGLRVLTVVTCAGPYVKSCFADTATVAQERALWELWELHVNNIDRHFTVVEGCRSYARDRPASRFIPVALGLEAWHLLRGGRSGEAFKALEALDAPEPRENRLAEDPLRMAGRRIARAWMTRLDRETVCQALRKVYLKKVEYPQALSALESMLPEGNVPPFHDRWGAQWVYAAKGFQRLKGFEGHRYQLESASLPGTSVFKDEIGKDYGARIVFEPLAVTRNADGVETIRFRDTQQNQDVQLAVATTLQNIRVDYCGERIIVLSDGNHWRVVTRPGQAQ